MAVYFDKIGEEKLYEMWIFFRILQLVSPVTQVGDRSFKNLKSGFVVQYQKNTHIEWVVTKFDNNNEETLTKVRRAPDIVISKDDVDIAVVDAKAMAYSELNDENKQEPGPERNIANQMIIYLDYVTQCNLGFVLFADSKMRNKVMLSGKSGSIEFLNCYPNGETEKSAFEQIRKCIYE